MNIRKAQFAVMLAILVSVIVLIALQVLHNMTASDIETVVISNNEMGREFFDFFKKSIESINN